MDTFKDYVLISKKEYADLLEIKRISEQVVLEIDELFLALVNSGVLDPADKQVAQVLKGIEEKVARYEQE